MTVCLYFSYSIKTGLSRLLFFNTAKILTGLVTYIENVLKNTHVRKGKLTIKQIKAV